MKSYYIAAISITIALLIYINITQNLSVVVGSQTIRTVSTPVLSNMLIIKDTNYKKSIACGLQVTAFCGPKVALIIDNIDWYTETKKPVSALYDTPYGIEVMAKAIVGLEKLVAAYDNIVGRIPAVGSAYNNRPIRLECAYLGNAGGLAGHGVYNFANGPDFIKQYINSIRDPEAYHVYQSHYWQKDNPIKYPIYYQHATTYELCRNYIFPDQFTPAFLYGVDGSKRGTMESTTLVINNSNYGWINQGFVNITGVLLVADMYPNVGLNYNGYSYQWFMNYMMGHLQKYIDGGKSWENTFLHEYLEWSPSNSLDNVYSGILATLWGSFGRTSFLKNWFGCLSLLPPTNYNVVIARDNFFLASCYGAQLNLKNYFMNTLRWPITEATLDKAQSLFGDSIIGKIKSLVANTTPNFSVKTNTPVNF